MNVLHHLLFCPPANPVRVVFTHGEDPRVLEAAPILAERGFVRPVLLGDISEMFAAIGQTRLPISEVSFVDCEVSAHHSEDRLRAAVAIVEQGDADAIAAHAGDMPPSDSSLNSICFVETVANGLLVCAQGPVAELKFAREFIRDLLGDEIGVLELGAGSALEVQRGPVHLLRCGSVTPCRLLREFGQASVYGPFFPDLSPPTVVLDGRAKVEDLLGSIAILAKTASLARPTAALTGAAPSASGASPSLYPCAWNA